MQQPVQRFALVLLGASALLLAGVVGWEHGARAHEQGTAVDQHEAVPTAGAAIVAENAPSFVPAQREENQPSAATSQGKPNTYQVVKGDTLTQIARRHGLSVAALKAANGLTTDTIKIGSTLVIPGEAPEQQHKVAQGETLWQIGVKYGVTLETLLNANPGVEAGHLQIGQVLDIPPANAPAQTAAFLPGNLELALSGKFAWPTNAAISSVFGPRDGRNHAGIDLANNHGDDILAARGGVVELAGWVTGYGETVILRHPDGTKTLYAHCSKLLVKPGQSVQQGERIALVGTTGNSTGPHLHFEIIVNDQPMDPLIFLPQR